MADGFLSRWSRRKLEADVSNDGNDGNGRNDDGSDPHDGDAGNGVMPAQAQAAPQVVPEPVSPAPAEPPPALTLDDVKVLTAESDFSRFVAADVSPQVKNAAMKKLFADPHYNVMDRMDIYIDDYSQPDPIPESMLRQLVAGKFLGLFKHDEKEQAETPAASLAAAQPRDVADNPEVQSVAQSDSVQPAVPKPPTHADPDLRLQQDDAPPGQGPGRGAP